MKSEDALPNTLCKSCQGKLKSFYEFRILCQKTDSTLRELTQNEDRKFDLSNEDINVQKDQISEIFDDLDDLPLLQRQEQQESPTEPALKRKRGRPKKSEAHPHTCTYCNKVLHTAKGLKTHLRSHTGEKLKHCLFCDAKYTRTNHLMRHIVTHDKPGVKHPCEQCDKTFEAAVELLKHFKVHTEVESEIFKIEKEEVMIEDAPELIEFAENNQNDVKTISNEHIDEDHNEIPIDQKSTVDETETGEDFTVDDGVGDRLEDDSDGSENLGTNNDQADPKKSKNQNCSNKVYYECEVCNKVLTTPKGFTRHLKKHIGTNALECKLCNKSFLRRSHLYRHMFTHTKGNNAKISEFEIQGLVPTGGQVKSNVAFLLFF